MGLKTAPLRQSKTLSGTRVLLSASLPDRTRPKKYWEAASPLEITDAVVSAAQSILSASGSLVFGGHPTISPLILSVADEFASPVNTERLAIVYQSELFKGDIAPQTIELVERDFAEIHWTARVEGATPEETRELSLGRMRVEMVRETDPVGAIFIGGMEGIEKEFRLFSEIFADRPAYPIGGPGGAAGLIANAMKTGALEPRRNFKKMSAESLLESHSYPALMKKIILDLTAFLS